MSRNTSIDELADVIMEELEAYHKIATDGMKAAVKKTATNCKKEISAGAPVRTGKYKKSWATKKMKENSTELEMTVYSKNRYQIAHLLEHGHALRNGGRASAIPHIAPAEEHAKQELLSEIERCLSNG